MSGRTRSRPGRPPVRAGLVPRLGCGAPGAPAHRAGAPVPTPRRRPRRRSPAIREVPMTAGSAIPHTRGTYPTIREVPGSGLGSRSYKRENPPQASITIRERHNLDGRGRSWARDWPHRGPTTTSRMAGSHVGRQPQRCCGPTPGRSSPSPLRCEPKALLSRANGGLMDRLGKEVAGALCDLPAGLDQGAGREGPDRRGVLHRRPARGVRPAHP